MIHQPEQSRIASSSSFGPYLELVNPESPSSLVLLCDHAGKMLPDEVGTLGIGDEMLSRHIGWDIGAADVTRQMAKNLDCAAVFNHVSRLVIDPNRRPHTPGSIPPVSDDCVVPGNHNLSEQQITQRITRYFIPYHRLVSKVISRIVSRGQMPIIIAIHSFTPRMDGEARPWHVGLMYRGDDRLARPILTKLRSETDLVIGDNQPYSGYRAFGYTINLHAQRPHFPHTMFEIRQDEIDRPEKALSYADLLSGVIGQLIGQPVLSERYEGDNLAESGGLASWRHASLISP